MKREQCVLPRRPFPSSSSKEYPFVAGFRLLSQASYRASLAFFHCLTRVHFPLFSFAAAISAGLRRGWREEKYR